MNKLNMRKSLGWFIALCYIVFLLLDFLMPQAWRISSAIKYAGLLACVTIALTGRDGTLRAAMLLTAACDFLLLFTQSFTQGVLAFACAQWLHAYRHAKLAGLPPKFTLLPATGLAAAAALTAYLIAGDALTATSAAYAVLLLSGTVFALIAMGRGTCDRRTATFASGGMLLFVLCDASVAAFNLGIPNAANLMWLFYLPSQWLLANSAPAEE